MDTEGDCTVLISSVYKDIVHYPGAFGLMVSNMLGRDLKFDRYLNYEPSASQFCFSKKVLDLVFKDKMDSEVENLLEYS